LVCISLFSYLADKGTEKEPIVSKHFPALLAAGTLALCLVVPSCSFTPSETTSAPSATETLNTDTSKLAGYWKSSYNDGFEINGATFAQYDDAAKGISFAGTVVNVRNINAASGYLTILVTNSGTWGKTVGSFYVIAWQIVSDSKMKESTAFKTGSTSNSGISTRIAAENEFTIDNGYFWFADYLKQ